VVVGAQQVVAFQGGHGLGGGQAVVVTGRHAE
jgi:hypothetical protein